MHHARTPHVAWFAGVALVALAACDSNLTPPSPTARRELAAASAGDPGRAGDPQLRQLDHIVVIYLENRSFDNVYGEFAGADGLAAAASAPLQVDGSGTPFATLPAVPGMASIPTNLPNAPFDIGQFVASNIATRDLVHRFYQEQVQIDGGRMDKFALVSDAKGLVMGFYHTAGLPLAAEAARYTLCDNLFHAAFGGSFLNHFWLIAAQTPTFPGAPASAVAQLDASGALVRDGFVTPDGYAVNTAFSVNAPHPSPAVSTSRTTPMAPRPRRTTSRTNRISWRRCRRDGFPPCRSSSPTAWTMSTPDTPTSSPGKTTSSS